MNQEKDCFGRPVILNHQLRRKHLVDSYLSGKSAKAVGKIFGISACRVLQILEKMKVPRRTPHQTRYWKGSNGNQENK